MKLGIDATAHIRVSGNWDTPTWLELDGVSDLDEACDWDKADVIIRRSLVKQGAKTTVDIGISCKILREPGNDGYDAIVAALRTRDTVDLLVLDGGIDQNGSEGVRYIAQVHKGGGSQNTGDALYRDIVFVPYPSADEDEVPQWASVTGSDGLSFTPITPDED